MNKKLIVLLLSFFLLFTYVQSQEQAELTHEQHVSMDVEIKTESDQGELAQDQGEEAQDQGELEEQPAEEQPAEEQPAEEQPAEEQPAEEQPAEEQPAEEQPAEEQPAEEEGPTEEESDCEKIETKPDTEIDHESKSQCSLCHPSCICEKGKTTCSKCRLESLGAVMDDHKRSCPCPNGYYTSSIRPFKCEQLFVPDQQGQIDEQGACDREVSQKARHVSLNQNCYYCVIDGISYVASDVSLNFNSVSISSECKAKFTHTVQFMHPTRLTYTDLDSKYVTVGENGSLKLKFPLIDVYNLTQSTNVGESQISQQINLMSFIGTKERVLRQIKWAICVYTNRDQVQIFQLDTDIQTTEQDCEDCVVIADLETIGEVYTDETFQTKVSGNSAYFVGDYFYAKISFVDSSYTKYLRFVALYYKNDLGQIFDFSSITVHSWQENGLTIALPLTEPSHPAYIQVQMVIDSKIGGRFLQEATAQEEDKQKSNFTVDVSSDSKPAGQDETQDSTSSQIIFLGLVNLMAMLFLF